MPRKRAMAPPALVRNRALARHDGPRARQSPKTRQMAHERENADEDEELDAVGGRNQRQHQGEKAEELFHGALVRCGGSLVPIGTADKPVSDFTFIRGSMYLTHNGFQHHVNHAPGIHLSCIVTVRP